MAFEQTQGLVTFEDFLVVGLPLPVFVVWTGNVLVYKGLWFWSFFKKLIQSVGTIFASNHCLPCLVQPVHLATSIHDTASKNRLVVVAVASHWHPTLRGTNPGKPHFVPTIAQGKKHSFMTRGAIRLLARRSNTTYLRKKKSFFSGWNGRFLH